MPRALLLALLLLLLFVASSSADPNVAAAANDASDPPPADEGQEGVEQNLFATAVVPSPAPSGTPSSVPSGGPTLTPAPSGAPSSVPSGGPTVTSAPSGPPSSVPSGGPTATTRPSSPPSDAPTHAPSLSAGPTEEYRPSALPSGGPSLAPSAVPSLTAAPSVVPSLTAAPSGQPSTPPSLTASPSDVPFVTPPPTPAPNDNDDELQEIIEIQEEILEVIEQRMNNTDKVALFPHEGCSFDRDLYCFANANATDDLFINRIPRNEIKSALTDLQRNEEKIRGIGLSANSTIEVDAYAIGVIINDVYDVDTLLGNFKAKIIVYLFKIRDSPYDSLMSASNAIYSSTSRTSRKNDGDWNNEQYYKLHDEDLLGASYVWRKGAKTDDGRLVIPDGVCSQYAKENLVPLSMDEYNTLSFRASLENAKLTPKQGNDGKLHHIVAELSVDFKPFNRKFHPFQVDLLDMTFGVTQSHLGRKSDIIMRDLMCLNPQYSGFGQHVAGIESKKTKLTIIPYLMTTLSEPWWLERGHFEYSLEKKQEQIELGNLGNRVNRILGLRIMVNHGTTKGWMSSFKFFFLSMTAILNFVTDDGSSVDGGSMLRAIVSVNTLVSSNTAYLAGGSNTIQSIAVYLAYAVNGVHIGTVTLMALINRLKKSGEERWFMRYQGEVYIYMRLLASSLCFFYLPLFTAFSTDTGDGSQENKVWVWVLSILLVVLSFLWIIVRDVRAKMEENRKLAELDKATRDKAAVAQAFKPFSSWSQEETTLWVKGGEMSNEEYFTDATRTNIIEKLDAARVDGGMLSRMVEGGDVSLLVNSVGLSLGDVDKLFVEVKRVMQTSHEEKRDLA